MFLCLTYMPFVIGDAILYCWPTISASVMLSYVATIWQHSGGEFQLRVPCCCWAVRWTAMRNPVDGTDW